MSKQALTLFGLSLAIVLGFGITYKNLAPVADDGYRSAGERAILKRYDANGDGELDAQEREQFKKEVQEQEKFWLDHFDLDGDGKVTDEEEEKFWLDHCDLNGDGEISEKEEKVLFDRFDLNGDGDISKAEERKAVLKLEDDKNP